MKKTQKIYQIRLCKWLRIRNPLEGEQPLFINEMQPLNEFHHTDEYVFLKVCAESKEEAHQKFRECKKEMIQYLWDNTPVNTSEDVEKFINEEVERIDNERLKNSVNKRT